MASEVARNSIFVSVCVFFRPRSREMGDLRNLLQEKKRSENKTGKREKGKKTGTE